MKGADWWSRVWNVLKSDAGLNEEATKQRVIEPALSYLGWDLFGSDVIREYLVDAKGRNENVDYALMVENAPMIFLEVKKLGSELGEKEARQVLGYAHLERIQWCCLTNGRKWRVYNAEWGRDPEEALFREWELNAGPDFPEAIKILSKASVAAGDLDKVGFESKKNQKMLGTLARILPELQDDLMRFSRNRLFAELRGEVSGLTRASVDQFIRERLQVSMRGAPEGRTTLETPPAEPRKRSARKPPLPDFPILRLEDLPDEEVVVFPSLPSGVQWMKDHNAWGYVRLSRLPPYLALYVSGGVGQILYFARTKRAVSPDDPSFPRNEDYKHDPSYKPGKKLIILELGSIRRLEPGIPFGEKKASLLVHRFYRLSSFKNARTIDDIELA